VLTNGKTLTFHGRIDRIDLWHDPATGITHFVVIDYKSGGKKLNKQLFEQGMHQQLSVYLLAIKASEKSAYAAERLEARARWWIFRESPA